MAKMASTDPKGVAKDAKGASAIRDTRDTRDTRKRLPCPRCGNPATHGSFCKECLQAVHPLVVGIKPGSVTMCASCPRVKVHSDWKDYDLEDALPRILGPCLQFASDAIIDCVDFDVPEGILRNPGITRKIETLAVVTGHHEDARADYEEEYDVPFEYQVTLCPLCKKKGTAYYEGILQVRNIVPAVRNEIREYLAAHRAKGLRLAKEVPVSTGSDYYLSDQRSVHHLAKHLHAHYGGELKIAAQHFSHDASAGKNLYRVNAYLEIPEYTKGDVIFRDDNYYFILGVSTAVKAENLITGEQESFPYRKGDAVRLPVKTTQVVSIDPVEVLHPSTYQAVTPTSSKYAPAELDIDQEVSVALDTNHLFLIPDTEERAETKRKKQRHSQKRKRKDDDLVNPD